MSNTGIDHVGRLSYLRQNLAVEHGALEVCGDVDGAKGSVHLHRSQYSVTWRSIRGICGTILMYSRTLSSAASGVGVCAGPSWGKTHLPDL